MVSVSSSWQREDGVSHAVSYSPNALNRSIFTYIRYSKMCARTSWDIWSIGTMGNFYMMQRKHLKKAELGNFWISRQNDVLYNQTLILWLFMRHFWSKGNSLKSLTGGTLMFSRKNLVLLSELPVCLLWFFVMVGLIGFWLFHCWMLLCFKF